MSEEIAGRFAIETYLEPKIRNLIAHVLKHCPKGRAEVAADLSRLTGVKVTKSMIDNWCSPSREGLRFPLSLARAFCQVTESDDLAFLAMRDSLRERAELGIALQPFLAGMAEKAAALRKRKKGRR